MRGSLFRQLLSKHLVIDTNVQQSPGKRMQKRKKKKMEKNKKQKETRQVD